ncbi:putative manganese transporter [Nocardioides sp. cx-173]|uniref:putative manganese transporter n=1 Tax=Nocardioides sp. cx-173 TaxID=2898796 RepID=UPI001E337E5E|nr:putative manganese transporter [Nocardioides sp. cx-173]MCD4523543.1 putative manganese transporter [Nocardioides sp. cx-173]UGB42119.1 putative manganese transporter [Nocardioides sp. cx-173]
MVDVLLRPLADAFMQVGVFVALLVAPFGWARFRWGHRLDDALVRHRRLGPLVAAALTVPPGCGGAIVVMAVYARGGVSYGAAIAALVATMGDASWVLLAADPVLTLQLKVLLVTVGALSGYAVDALGIAPRRRVDAVVPTARPLPVDPAPRERVLVAAGHVPAAVRLHELGVLPALLWLTLGTGATVSLPVTFQLLRPDNLYLVLGVAGTAVAVVAFVRGGCKLADDDDRTAHPTSMTQVLRHGGHEIAFVTVWVAVAYLAWSMVTHLTGFDGSQLPLFGVAGVVVGALVGLIPGCAVQIVFAGIFLAGGMPLSTLVANTVSQDGDALLPLLALEHRSALLATVLTTVPALLVGAALLVLT